MSHWLRHGKDVMSWKTCEDSIAARSKITPGSFRTQLSSKCSSSTDHIRLFFFPSLVIECSHCPRATGTYSDPFSCLKRHFISAICRKTFLMWKRPNTKPLPSLIKYSTFVKCFLNISPLWLSSLLLFRSSKTSSLVSFQYLPVVGISLFLSYFTYPVQKVLPPCSL